MTASRSSPIAELRALVNRHDCQDLEACLQQAIEGGWNGCLPGRPQEEAINLLAKAAYVRSRMEAEQLEAWEAIRALGARMRGLFVSIGIDAPTSFHVIRSKIQTRIDPPPS